MRDICHVCGFEILEGEGRYRYPVLRHDKCLPKREEVRIVPPIREGGPSKERLAVLELLLRLEEGDLEYVHKIAGEMLAQIRNSG